MNRLFYILLIISAASFALNVHAQDNQHGSVVIHSDPRLSLLLSRTHTAPKPQPAEKPHNVVEKSHPVTRAAIAEKDHPVIASASIPARPHPIAAPVASVAPATTAVTNAAAPKPAGTPVPRYYYERLTSNDKGRVIYSGKGFRVQIYNGQDRNKAMDVKMEFMRRYPGTRTYLTYMSPCFRVKVGNYRNRSDAEGMFREMKSMYGPCMIVPDIITVSTY